MSTTRTHSGRRRDPAPSTGASEAHVAAQREADRRSVGEERPRSAWVAGHPQRPQRVARRVQRGDEIVMARLGQRRVEPEESPLRAQGSDTLSSAGIESVEDLRHGLAA